MSRDPSESSSLYDRVRSTATWLESRIDAAPEIALILGSGLGALADTLDDGVAFDYQDIPNFPVSAVEGHAGRLVSGTLRGKRVLIMQGRVHYYEGWSLDEVTFPVRVFGLLGVPKIMITNSAGGANPDFHPGELMLIDDHINLTGANPLRGPNESRFGLRFPDMSEAYSKEMSSYIQKAARRLDFDLRRGVYVGVAGPSYETPAEVRMIQTIGGDAVGMSTVPETIIANHMGMQVGGISCITNVAAGLSAAKLDHDDVKRVAAKVRDQFVDLVSETVALLPTQASMAE